MYKCAIKIFGRSAPTGDFRVTGVAKLVKVVKVDQKLNNFLLTSNINTY